jgi:putative transposase
MQKWQQWESASEADWGLAVEQEAVIRPLAEQQKLCVEDVEAAVRHLRIGRSVLYNLVHRYRQRPRTSSLLPLKRGRDTYTTVLDQNRELLLDSCTTLSRLASCCADSTPVIRTFPFLLRWTAV